MTTLSLGPVLDSSANWFCELNEDDHNYDGEEEPVLSLPLSGLSLSWNKRLKVRI
jgi:hypothetical protein